MEKFQIVLLEEVRIFLQDIPKQAQKKVLYNIWRVTGGEKNKEIFKKLENSEIWEFRTLYNGIAYRLFAFWDTKKTNINSRYPRHYQENAKDSSKGNRKGRDYNETIF